MGNGRWQNYKGRYLKMGKKLQFTELDQYLFGQGTNYDIYRKLGAHPDTQNRKKGVYFAVWAPNAQAVSVVGEFNEWDTKKNPMKKVGPIGVYETFVPGAKIGNCINFTLQVHMARNFTRQIPMPTLLRCVLEQPPVLPTSPIINGKMIPG